MQNVNITLTLNEIAVLLLAITPRDKQDLGKYFHSARTKLQAAQNALLGGKVQTASKALLDGVTADAPGRGK